MEVKQEFALPEELEVMETIPIWGQTVCLL